MDKKPPISPKSLQLVSVRWWNASAYYAISLADALQQAGHQAICAGRENSPPLKKAKEWHLPHFTGINLESLHPGAAIKNLRALKKLIADEKIELINAHRPEDHFFAALLTKFGGIRTPVIRTVSDVRPPRAHRINRWLHEKATDFFIFSSHSSLRRYQEVWPIFSENSVVIHSAIDTNEFQPIREPSSLRAKLAIPEDSIVIGLIARLSPVKGHRVFLRAAKLVLDKFPKAYFLIAGESCEISHAELQKEAAELGIGNNVIHLERSKDYSIKELIGSIDIAAVTSLGSEVICRIAVENMAMAKPLVVSDVNVLPEIVEDGRNGFVVPADNPEILAERLLKLAKSGELRQTMGETGRRFAETRFSYPVFIKQTLDLYRRAMSASVTSK